MVESGFLLRSCVVKSCTVGSNPTLSEFYSIRKEPWAITLRCMSTARIIGLEIVAVTLSLLSFAPDSFAQKPTLCDQYWQAAKQLDESGKHDQAERYWTAAVTVAEKTASRNWFVTKRGNQMWKDLELHPKAAISEVDTFVRTRLSQASPAEVKAQLDRLEVNEQYLRHLNAANSRIFGSSKEKENTVKIDTEKVANLKQALQQQAGAH